MSKEHQTPLVVNEAIALDLLRSGHAVLLLSEKMRDGHGCATARLQTQTNLSLDTFEDYWRCWAFVPRLATAENGMKSQFIGEYVVKFPELDENGEEYIRTINIPWTVLKDIYSDMVAFGSTLRPVTEDREA